MYTSFFIDSLINESRAILEEAAMIDTSPYETINDDSPSGKDLWSFAIDAYPDHPADFAKLERTGKLVDYEGEYTQAIKWVKQKYPAAKVIYLLP